MRVTNQISAFCLNVTVHKDRKSPSYKQSEKAYMCFETRRVGTRDFTVYVLCTYFYHYIWLSLHAYDKANKQIFALINFLHNVYKTLLLLVKHLTLFCRHKPKINPKYGFV